MEPFKFKVFWTKHGTIIVGIVLKAYNIILLGSDSRMVWSKTGTICVDENGDEFLLTKLKSNNNFGLAMCGDDIDFTDAVTNDMINSKNPYTTSENLAEEFKDRFVKAVHHKKLEQRKGLNAGVIVGTFDNHKGKYIPKLLRIELLVKGSTPSARHKYFPKFGFDGAHWEKLEKYLEGNWDPIMSLKKGIEVLKTSLRIARGTCMKAVKGGEQDIVGGSISVMEIHLASPEDIKAGKLVNVILREFEEPLVGEDPPDSPKGKYKGRGKNKR